MRSDKQRPIARLERDVAFSFSKSTKDDNAVTIRRTDPMHEDNERGRKKKKREKEKKKKKKGKKRGIKRKRNNSLESVPSRVHTPRNDVYSASGSIVKKKKEETP